MPKLIFRVFVQYVSLLWFVTVMALSAPHFLAALGWDFPGFKVIELGTLGDFIGGTMQPLALLWLVMGYFQQGEELRLNTEALKSQQKEMKKQAEVMEAQLAAFNAQKDQMEAQVRALKSQAKASRQLARATENREKRDRDQRIRELMPRFYRHGSQRKAKKTWFQIMSYGADISNVRFLLHDGPQSATFDQDKHFHPRWEVGHEMTLGFDNLGDGEADVEVSFTHAMGGKY